MLSKGGNYWKLSLIDRYCVASGKEEEGDKRTEENDEEDMGAIATICEFFMIAVWL